MISGAGGLLALVHVAVDFGSWLEFAGMTVAIAWLATYGLALVVESREVSDVATVPDARESAPGEAAAWRSGPGLSGSGLSGPGLSGPGLSESA